MKTTQNGTVRNEFLYRTPRCWLGTHGVLTACGGGGSSDAGTTPATASPLAGGWEGNSGSGDGIQAMILEDGRIWAVSGPQASGVLAVNSLGQR